MVNGLQLIGFIFVLGMLYYTFINYKKGAFDKNIYLMWSILWLIVCVIIWIPNYLTPITKALSFESVKELLLIGGLLLCLSVTFYNFTVVKRMEKRIERLVRNLAKK